MFMMRTYAFQGIERQMLHGNAFLAMMKTSFPIGMEGLQAMVRTSITAARAGRTSRSREMQP